ncbi:MAG: LptA/OstA family protein [Acidobacteriota bacterium]
MPLKKILSFISLTVFLFAVIVVILSFKGGGGVGDAGTEEIIGRELEYKVYNDLNKLSVYITSSSSKRDFDRTRKPAHRERTLLKDIKGVIYKGKKFKNDLKFSGNSGYVENEYKNFLLRDKARIESEDILFTSKSFFMEGSSLIMNKTPTKYKLKNLNGVARKGMNYHMDIGAVNLLKTSGTHIRSGKKYQFRCNRLMVLKKFNRLVFKGNAEIRGEDSIIRGREIILKFTKDFKNLIRTDINGKAYFRARGDKKGEFREMSGKNIKVVFDKNEQIKNIDISKNGKIYLSDKANKLKAESNLIYIRFNEETSKLKRVKLMKNGRVTASGKRSFDITSQRIRANYDDAGEIELCNAYGKTSFKIEEYSGNTVQLSYIPPENNINLEGEKSVLQKGENRFVSSEFNINTKEGKLSSEDEITSVINLKSENSIFSKAPVFVHSKRVEIDDKSGSITYIEDVTLFQGETKLNSEKVEIGDNNKINVSGSVELNFKNGEKGVIISGKELNIDPENNLLNIKGTGVLGEGENSLSGESLSIQFNDKKEINLIKGEKDIEFKRKEISGRSDKVEWEFIKKMITFISNARLIKTKSGTSKGDKIIFYLENEKVVIKSTDGKRSETEID